MGEAPGILSDHGPSSFVRPQAHAPLNALLSALSSFNNADEAPGGLGVSIGGEKRGRSAFAPIPSASSTQVRQLITWSLDNGLVRLQAIDVWLLLSV